MHFIRHHSRIFLVACAVFASLFCLLPASLSMGRSTAAPPSTGSVSSPSRPAASTTPRQRFLVAAGSQVGVRESTGHNDGPQVEAYLAAAGAKKGDPWCAAFIVWCGDQAVGRAANPIPRSAWSPDLVSGGTRQVAASARPGDVGGIYFADKGRIAHVVILTDVSSREVRTIEGNTNAEGSREGNQCARRIRPIESIRQSKAWW